MRNLKSFFVLLSAFLVVCGLLVYIYKFSDQTDKEEQAKAFPHILKSEIQKVSITSPEHGHFQLIHKESNWNLEGEKSGIKDIADSDRVHEWLDAILKAQTTPIEKEGPDWPKYGLDKNFQTIELSLESRPNSKLDISSQKSFDGKFFLRRGEKLLLGEEDWSDLTDKSDEYFRSHKLVNTRERVRKFQYTSEKDTIALEMEDYDWKWTEDSHQENFPISQSGIDNYLTALSRLRFSEGAEILSKTEDLQKQYKLLKPNVLIDMEFNKGEKLSLKLSSKIKDQYYATVSNREYIFSLTDDEAQRILWDKKDFKDHNFPFRVEKDLAHFIELKSESLNLKLKKDKDQWVRNQNSDRELNTEESDQLLNRITDISAEKYFGNRSFEVKSQITLKNKEEKNILSLEMSEPFKSKTEESERVYVKSSLGTETMSVSLDAFEKIFSSRLFKEKQQDESSEGKESDTN